MSRHGARRGLSALLTLALAAAAVLLVAGRPAPARGPAFALAADGALTLDNDRAGGAILQAAALRPGDLAEGTVTLTATGGGHIGLQLERVPGAERPGTGGGRLADRLLVAIDDVTTPQAPVTVYLGGLQALRALALEPLAGGAARRYRFRVHFPAGDGDDRFQGASLATGFVWTATQAAPAAPSSPTPAAPTAPAAPQPAAPAAAAARVSGMPSSRRCVRRKRYRVRARPAPGVRVTSVTAYVDQRRQRGRRHGRSAVVDLRTARRARTRVRVVVATSAGRVTVKARYRLCR